MKKITLLLLLLFISASGYSQLFGNTEGFESTSGITGSLPQIWPLGTGDWAVFERNTPATVGSGESWGINPFAAAPVPYQGINCASVSREQINQGSTSEDYLATSVINIPPSGITELHFWTRMFTSGNQGTIYKVMIAPAFADQSDPLSYSDLQQWTENDLIIPTSNFNVWTEKTVDLSAYAGFDVYIAFVKVYTQPTADLDGDRWLIDNVGVNTQCTSPVTGTTSAITSNSATLTWTNPGGASSFHVVVTPTAGGTSLPFDFTTPPFIVTGLTPNTQYNYTVEGICGSGFSSPPSAPSANFTTQLAPPVCGGNLVDSGGIGGNYSNNEIGTPITVTPAAGQLVTITFTAFDTEAGNDILRIYDGPNTTFPLLATLSGAIIPPSYTSSAVSGALTFTFTSNGTTVRPGYVADISCNPAPSCRIPTAANASAITTNSLTLNWTQPANPDSSVANVFDILVLAQGSAAPTASSVPTYNDITPGAGPSFGLTGLTSGTCFDIYIRAVCSVNSAWIAVPVNACTLIAPPVCGGNYVDSGGISANYPNNATETSVICPTSGSGDAVTVTFTAFNTEAGIDLLKVYDGDSVSATLLATLSGTTLPPSFTSTSPTGCLTFAFTSNGSVTNTGWVANVSCAPPAPCSPPTVLTNSVVTHNSVTLNWVQAANPNGSNPTSWDVYALPCGSPAPGANPTGGIAGTASTNTNFVFTGLTPLTCYDVYVRSSCPSAWTGPTTFTTLAAPPECGGNFVDSGGTTANYANGENITTIICPTTPGDVVTVTFTAFNTEATWDALYVYHGNAVVPANLIASANGAGNVPGGLAGGYWGTTIPCPFTSSAANGCLTFVFRSDTSVNNPGWVSNITCGPPPTCQIPTSLVASGVTSTTAVLNWTQPANGNSTVATTWDIIALPCASPPPSALSTPTVNDLLIAPPYTLTGLATATCYDIYVRAVCSASENSSWICVPATITTQVAPPVCGGNFVDAAGPSANYANSSDSTVSICPTPGSGDVVTVTFTSFFTELNWDGLLVYDGGTTAAPQISSGNGTGNGFFNNVTGAFWGNLTGANLPGPFTSSSSDGCLTFRFVSDTSVNDPGWIANITCSPAPACPKPNTLTATAITATSALLGWTELNPNVSQWQVYLVPQGSPAPLPDTTTGWVTVSTNPAPFTGLLPATQYTFYVRSVCPDGSNSLWSAGFTFATLIINDNCDGAIFAPVNSAAVCQQITPGTLTGATASNPAPEAPCVGTADDDVWFQFIATNQYLNVSLQNITGTTTALNFAAYSGQCGTLTQIFCSAVNTVSGVLNNLTIGDTYYIRVYSNGTTPQTVNFNLCISTPSTCPTASTVCSLTNYANTTGVANLGTIGCLFTAPNPAYFTIQIATTGPVNYTLTQSTTPGGAANIDVDYAAWGPFTSQDEACNFIGIAQPYAAPGIGVPVTQQTGCSYSAAPTETLNIANAVAGQFYIILITNFSNQAGFISLTQNNTTAPGHGTTNCCPDAYFSYVPASFCKDPSTPNPLPIIAQSSVSGVFSSTLAPGLVFVDSGTNTGSLTGQIDIMASAPGNYVVTNTVAATINPTCSEKVKSYTINITAPTSASFDYGGATSFCNVISTPQPATLTGTTGGSFSASPNGGLAINVATGAITPSASSPGIYTVTYALPGSGVCVGSNPSMIIEIIDAPEPTFTQVQPVCPGDPLADLPTSSNDSPPITGTWSPAIDNTQTTTYTFTPTAGQCAVSTTMTISVGSTTPTFTQVAPICQGAPLADLPTTSNGPEFVVGTWSPAMDNTQTTTYTFTPTSGNCVGSASMTIEVLTPTIVPTFNDVAPICPNGVLADLPTTSTNNITGTWSPALDNTQTTTYTFTPDSGQCGVSTTLTIVVNPALVVSVNNPTFCPGSTATVVATPAIPGTYSYTWTVPAGASNPGNVASFDTSTPGTYTVVIDQVSNFCNTDFESPLATGTSPNLFNETLVPCWDTTAADGIIEIWPPGFEGVTAYSGNQLIELNANTVGTLFQDFTVIPGTTISVSFAHRGRQGNDVVGVEIGPVGGPYVNLGNFTDGNTAWTLHTVNYTIPIGGGNNYTLRFVSVSSTGGNPSVGNLLDTISISTLSCTSAPTSGVVSIQTLPDPIITVIQPTCTVQTGTIEVTPPADSSTYEYSLDSDPYVAGTTFSGVMLGLHTITVHNLTTGCYSLPFDVTIGPIVGETTPTFSFGTTLNICSGDAVPTLPTSSDNTILGTWSPDVVDNVTSGVYTFTPDSGQCAATITFTVTVAPQVTPTFSFGTTLTICSGDAVPTLTDSSDNTITGVWSPDVVDNTTSGVYTFTPDTGQCAISTSFSVSVTPQITPTFSFGTALTICSGDAVPSLTTSSSESIPGTWSPAVVDNTTSGVYTFTPDAGQCATTTIFTLTVAPQTTPTFSFGTTLSICSGEAVPTLPNSSDNTVLGTWSPAVVDNVTGGVYTFTPNSGQCALSTTFTVTVTPQVTPIFSFGTTLSICSGDAVPTLPTSSTNAVLGIWSPAVVSNTSTGTYTFTPNAGQCGATITFTVTVAPQITPTFGFGTTLTICSGDAVPTLTTSSSNSINGTWSPSTVNNLNSGSYTFTPASGQCATTTTFIVSVTPPILIELNGGCQSVYVLTATPVNGSFNPETASFTWHNAQGAIVGSSQSIDVPAIGFYTVTVNVDGCQTESSAFEVTSIACQIQKGISVNNDGLNDTFDLTGFDVKQLTIFNRLGMKVYSRANYVNEWGGKSDKGDELPDGTYFYVIDINSGGTKTGWIYINRAQ